MHDTQPRSPFRQAPTGRENFVSPNEPPTANNRNGCLILLFGGLMAFGLAAFIVLLAGLAGWTSGQRIAQTNATATQAADIAVQLQHIPDDLNNANWVILSARLDYLATLTPAVPGLSEWVATATAAYQLSLPTATPTPSATLPPTVTPTAQPTVSGGTAQPAGVDLNQKLVDGQNALNLQDWDTAINNLEYIISADANFQTVLVRASLAQAMSKKALLLLRSPDLGDMAEGVRLVDTARQYGDTSEADYEAYIAGQYLDALSYVGINYPRAIQAFSNLYNTAPNYRDVLQKLYQLYVSYGDAYANSGEFCPAAPLYQNALVYFNDVSVSAKLTNAQTMCAQATPVGDLMPGATVAPIGVGS